MVPNPCDTPNNAGRLQKCTNLSIEATSYFDFLTNNDDTRTQYWGGMSTYNFRQYSDPD
jgi:hypothetical protein